VLPPRCLLYVIRQSYIEDCLVIRRNTCQTPFEATWDPFQSHVAVDEPLPLRCVFFDANCRTMPHSCRVSPSVQLAYARERHNRGGIRKRRSPQCDVALTDIRSQGGIVLPLHQFADERNFRLKTCRDGSPK
jgi:hypothetical protein